MSPDSRARRRDRELPRLHAVTDDTVLHRAGFEALAVQVLEAGGPHVALHLRGPGTGPREILDLATALMPHVGRAGASLFVNDRVDVALVADVDGVHLGGGSLPAGHTRALLGPGPWIGVSRHGEEWEGDTEEGADYVFLGTLYPTASHPEVDGLGIQAFRNAVSRSPGLPIVGIGGIGPDQAPEVMGSGAYGVAAIRGIWDASDPGKAVTRYLEGLGNRREQR